MSAQGVMMLVVGMMWICFGMYLAIKEIKRLR